MIDIYKSSYTSPINHFHGKTSVSPEEVKLITKFILGKPYTFAEPSTEGRWAFGGTLLFTSNGVHSEFNTPIKLHDRNMDLER